MKIYKLKRSFNSSKRMFFICCRVYKDKHYNSIFDSIATYYYMDSTYSAKSTCAGFRIS